MPEDALLQFIRAPHWRHTDDEGVELYDERRGTWQRIKPWAAPILEALADGMDLPALVARAKEIPVSKDPVKAEMRLRLFLYTLHRLGHITLPRPPPVEHPRYVWRQELGRGGVAVADLVEDTQTGALLAMKRAWDFLQPYAVTEAAIRHEAEVLGALDHPNIVALHDTFEREGHMHLVRDAVEGDEFTANRGTGVPTDQMARLAEGIIDLLGHIHDRGYLLIDLRPGNFFRRPDGSPVLVDVGQCRRHTDGRLHLGRRIGSRGFLSPEMEATGTVTMASDLYGYGLLLLYLRTGEMPRRRVRHDKLSAYLADDPWGPLIINLLEPDAAKRPRDAAAVRALLERSPAVGVAPGDD